MDVQRASLEAQCVMALGAVFAVMVIAAAIHWWYSVTDQSPPRRGK